jgi:hypothetical protein
LRRCLAKAFKTCSRHGPLGYEDGRTRHSRPGFPEVQTLGRVDMKGGVLRALLRRNRRSAVSATFTRVVSVLKGLCGRSLHPQRDPPVSVSPPGGPESRSFGYRGRVSGAPLRQLRVLAATLAVAAMALAGHPASAPASEPVTSSFTTQGTPAAYCVFFGAFVKYGYTPYLVCARMPAWSKPSRRWVMVRLKARRKPEFKPLAVGSWLGGTLSSPAVRRRLRVGENWWGNRQGEEGKGSGRGRILFRCTSRVDGLTCRSQISGHGFWLGRIGGLRVI